MTGLADVDRFKICIQDGALMGFRPLILLPWHHNPNIKHPPHDAIITFTRMHSSRIPTACSLTVSRSICHARAPAMHTPPATHAPPAMHAPCHHATLWTEFLTHASENVSLSQLRLISGNILSLFI